MNRWLGQALKRLPSPQRETWMVRGFGLSRVPMIGFVWPSVKEINDMRSNVVIPFKKRNRNHIGSMYLGTMCVGADLSAGILAEYWINQLNNLGSEDDEDSKDQESLAVRILFKNLKADFRKKAIGPTEFRCEQGLQVRDGIQHLMKKGGSTNLILPIEAWTEEGQVAEFSLTMNLKSSKRKMAQKNLIRLEYNEDLELPEELRKH